MKELIISKPSYQNYLLIRHFHFFTFCNLYEIQFNPKIVDDEILPLWRILPHIILQQVLNVVSCFHNNRIEFYVRANKTGKFLRAYFAQSFKPGDLWFA